MAVRPERQNQGIGSALITQGMAHVREMGCALIVVLGHAEYYNSFGFTRASRHGLTCQGDGVPDEAFMVGYLKNGPGGAIRGTVRCPPEFNAAMEKAGPGADEPA
jgi:putative acetyltransferase